MRDRSKEEFELVSSRVAAAALSGLPGGAILSAVFLAPIELADRRRTANLIMELQSQVTTLNERGLLNSTLDELVESDRFMANLTTAIRASQTTTDEEKRRHLRNAVLNVEITSLRDEFAEHYLRLIAKYTSVHVRILRVAEPLPPFESVEASYPIEEGKRKGIMRDLSAICRAALPDLEPLVNSALLDLSNDGLLIQSQPESYELQDQKRGLWPDTISANGLAFLRFINDPLG